MGTDIHDQSFNQRMLSDENFKPSHKQSISRYLWDNDKQELSEYLIEGRQHSLPKKLKKVVKWCHKNYPNAIPKASFTQQLGVNINDVVSRNLNQSKKFTITHSFFTLDLSDIFMDTWFVLLNKYGYNSETNQLKELDNAYLKEVRFQLTKNQRNQSIPFNYNTYFDRELDINRKDNIIVSDVHEITLVYAKEKNNEQSIKLDITLDNNSYLYANYIMDNQYYWFKKKISDDVIVKRLYDGKFYPRLYIRANFADILNHDEKTKNKIIELFKQLNLDLNEVTKQIQKNIGDGYQHVAYMFLNFSINTDEINQSDKVILEYLFKFLTKAHNTVEDKRSVTLRLDDDFIISSSSVVGLTKETKQGKFKELKVGEYYFKYEEDKINVLQSKKYYRLVYQQETDYIEFIFNYFGGSTINTYTLGGYLPDHIPLDMDIIAQLNHKEQEYLLHKSFHIMIYMRQWVKTKWYQTKAFRNVLQTITFAISIAGSPLAGSVVQSLRTILFSVAKSYLVKMALQQTVKLAVKVFGLKEDVAKVILVVGAILFKAKQNNWDFTKLLTAPNLMKFVNKSFDAYNSKLITETKDIIQQQNEFNTIQKKQSELLASRQKLLLTKVYNPQDELLRSNYTTTVDVFETVDMFYARHFGFNVVDISHGLISNYVEMTLANKQVQQKPNESIDDILLIN